MRYAVSGHDLIRLATQIEPYDGLATAFFQVFNDTDVHSAAHRGQHILGAPGPALRAHRSRKQVSGVLEMVLSGRGDD